jgi:hypothetical protein
MRCDDSRMDRGRERIDLKAALDATAIARLLAYIDRKARASANRLNPRNHGAAWHAYNDIRNRLIELTK